ncbi:MAG: hypothetical protein ACUVXG_06295 [Anaerolineae bacterium]
MECPNCGTWNPDDKKQCWRCDAVLPTPPPPKPKRKPLNWIWIAVGLFLLITILQACWALQGQQPTPIKTGLAPSEPAPLAWMVAPDPQGAGLARLV